MISNKLTSFFLATAVHAAVFTAGSAVFVKPAEYGIETGDSAVEVSLVAALPAPEPETTPAVVQPEPEAALDPQPKEAMIEDVVEKESEAAVRPRTEVSGDGSSPIPGKDSTTLYASPGASTEAKPNYLKNPPPRYPEAARRAGQEGLVILWAEVTVEGRADSVTVRQSSGYPILDEAALRAVKKWKFYPAKIGTLPVASRVEVPIRFQLNEDQSRGHKQ
ncbi:MAG TPA: energy transducer TonB [Candidatus Omnitrophota bacterium]|nr:energy transducer TonB [Candidatus Omnitrophota bacterium]